MLNLKNITFKLGIKISSPFSMKRCSGLIPIFLSVDFPGWRKINPEGYTLRLIFVAAGLDHEYTLTSTKLDSTRTISFNSHLFPNGSCRVTCFLMDPSGALRESNSLEFNINNVGVLAEKVRESLRQYRTPLVIEGKCDSSHFNFSDKSLTPWFDRVDAANYIENLRNKKRINEQEEGALTQFVNDGYAILPNIIEEELVCRINNELDDAVMRKIGGYEYGSSQRIENLHQRYPGVRTLWTHPKVLHYLKLIFQSEPLPCQTLSYIFGSQQDAHQDTIHLTPFPAGYMCGVWVALEDVREGSGELAVYPGSHRLPRVYMRDVNCEKVTSADWTDFGKKVVPHWQKLLINGGYSKVLYRPKSGDVLIWHENLMHEGTVRLDKALTRRSVVSHIFASGSISFYDSSGSPGYLESIDELHS